MGHILIIAEKPNAADRIAKALAEGEVKTVKKHTVSYYKIKRGGKEILVVPAVGHLFALSESGSSLHWRYPVFSVEWKPTFTDKSNFWAKKYFQNIQELSRGADEFISACDYDVEGSVIAFNIIRFICKKNDGKRMKFSTLTEPDLVEAYDKASIHLDFPQIEAGLARHELDWYFGINLSRALTLALEHVGGYWILSTGRVQGPTLSILEKRQKEIEAFRPKPFWQLLLHGSVEGKKIEAIHEKENFWKKEEVLGAFGNCKLNGGYHKGVVEDVERREHKQNPPFPFDLTTLQRESYSLFGYSPKMTLDIAQSLYEHALISYPRTSSQKLPAKIGYKKILERLSKQKDYESLCGELLQKKTLKPNEGSKTDPAHPAIFPTGNSPKKLSNYQKKVYDLVTKRFLATFAEPAIREMVKVIVSVNSERFLAHGITTLHANWIDFYKPYARFKEQALPEIKKGEEVSVEKMEILDKETQPPSRFTQASILKEMESLGLGTKVTRAHILDTLYQRSYIKEASIHVTELGEAVVTALEKNCPEIISVELTKRLDNDMEAIEAGKVKREDVLRNAREELEKILAGFKENEPKIGKEIIQAIKKFEKEIHDVGKCKCGGELKIIHSKKTGKRFIGCSNYPKCTNSYPLPQHGYIEVISKTCKCGLKLVSVKAKGRRPWRFCVKCGFQTKAKKKAK